MCKFMEKDENKKEYYENERVDLRIKKNKHCYN
jgi:hypothetical protein